MTGDHGGGPTIGFRATLCLATVLLACAALPTAPLSTAAQGNVYLALTPLPPQLPTTQVGQSFPALAVSLVDSKGNPLVAQTAVTVYLSSSNPDALSVQDSVAIGVGQQYAIASVTTPPTPGGSTVTAVSPGFESASVSFQTSDDTNVPTQLGIYLAVKSSVVSKVAGTLDLVVQFQTPDGKPATAQGSTDLLLSFSNKTLFQSPMNLTAGQGDDTVYTTLPIGRATSGTFTIIANGMNSASAKYSAVKLAVTSNLTPNKPAVQSNEPDPVYYSLSVQGVPQANVSLQWSSTGGTLSSSSTTTSASGASSVIFSPTNTGLATVTVVADDQVIGEVNATANIIVTAPPVSTPPTLMSEILSYLPYIGVAAAAVVIVVVIVWRRRRGGGGEEEGFELGAPS